jgi:hypothetical protein
MGSFSDHWEGEILDHLFDIGAYSAPSFYVALSTADPTDDGSGIAEPVGNAYARKLHAAWARSGSTVDNTGVVEFAEATGSWGTVTHFALFDALSGGNMLGHGTLDTSRAIGNGDTPRFADGELDVTLD